MEKKTQYVVIGVIAIIAIAGIIGGTAIYANMPKGGHFIFGVMYAPVDLDPHYTWDSASVDVIDQVCEGLFTYDWTDPNLAIVPNLATSWSWSEDGTELTCQLRQGVKFHDGTNFNAEAVKWNFDRINGFLDTSICSELWFLASGDPIISETVVIDEYTVKIVLNAPYSPFLGLAASWSLYMMSPASTPQDEYLDLATDDLVGTGAFIYDSYETGVEVLFSINEDYWGGAPAIDDLTFSVITDADARNSALLTGEISKIDEPMPSMIQTFMDDPNIYCEVVGTTTTIQYLGMNNKVIPVQMRKALAYALDYDYIIQEIKEGYASRMRSPIPKGIMYSNTEDFDVPILDLVIARQTLIDAGFADASLPLDDDAPWENLVDGGTPIAKYNYTYNIGNPVREDILPILIDNYKKIGVEIEDCGMTWDEFNYRVYEIGGLYRNMLNLYFVGWIPDYNDPSNYINMLMTNQAVACNGAQIDDDLLQQWMEEAIEETNPDARKQLYYEIQERWIEELYPWCMCYVDQLIPAQVADLRGYMPNAMRKEVFKTVYFV